ncbi:MAG: hypothetical protein KGL39_26395 [Patescibacteria group bacterium]|nr:hypothetical protein [Patescibacteria group bacterium]
MANAAMAAKRVGEAIVTGQKLVVSAETKSDRMDVCKLCPHFRETKLGQQCAVCGCWLNLKAFLETEHCPLKKW